MKETDKEHWQHLLLDEGIDHEDACERMERILSQGHLPAMDPSNSKRRVQVRFQPTAGCITHFLFKDEANPNGQRLRSADQFRSENARRIHYIQQTLLNPDEIRRAKEPWREKPAFYYVCETAFGERFTVVLGRDKNTLFFRTAYPVRDSSIRDQQQWKKALGSSAVAYMRKK